MQLVDLAVVPILAPMVAALVLIAASKWLPRGAVDVLAIAAAATVLGGSAYLAYATRSSPILYWAGDWTPRGQAAIGIALYVDPIGAGIATLAGALATAALVYSARYFHAFEGRYHALVLLFAAAMAGFCLTLDLFNLFVWFELMSVTAFALTPHHKEDRAAVHGGLVFAISNSLGSFASLFGLGLLYAHTGALNLAHIGAVLQQGGPEPVVVIGAWLVIIGMLVKAAIVPFHFWLSDAHAVAPSPVSAIFSGVMVPLGVYGVARIYWTALAGVGPGFGDALSAVLVGFGVATVVVGSVMCWLQTHVKRMLAFSTIAHTGILLLGIACWNVRGLAGAALYLGAHGLAKAALFLCAGILLHRFASVHEDRLYGAGRRLVGVALIYAAGALALAGVPPFATGPAHAAIDTALEETGRGWISWLMLGAAAVTTAAVLRAGARIFFGWGHRPVATHPGDDADAPGAETAGPRGHVPVLLWLPALVLVGAGASLVAIDHGVLLEQAARFTTPARYSAAVYGMGGPLPVRIAPPTLGESGPPWWIGAALAAALAAAALWLPPMPRLARAANALRDLHRGDLGLYATWILAAVALGGAALLALALRA